MYIKVYKVDNYNIYEWRLVNEVNTILASGITFSRKTAIATAKSKLKHKNLRVANTGLTNLTLIHEEEANP